MNNTLKYISSLVILGVFVLSFQVRTSYWDDLVDWEGQDIIIPDVDAAYHYSLIKNNILSGTDIRHHDQRVYAPFGYTHHWPSLFDKGFSVLGKLIIFLGGSYFLFAIILGFIPPLISSLTIVLAFRFLKNRLGLPLGIVSSLFIGLNPLFVTASSYGVLDHHFLEICLTLLLFFVLSWPCSSKRSLIIAFTISAVGLYSTTTFFLSYIIMNIIYLRDNRKLLSSLNIALAVFILFVNILFDFSFDSTYRQISLLHIGICTLFFLLNYFERSRKSIVGLIVLLLTIGLMKIDLVSSVLIHIYGSKVNLNNVEVLPITWTNINIPIVRSLFVGFVVMLLTYFYKKLRKQKGIFSGEIYRLSLFAAGLAAMASLQGRFLRDNIVLLTVIFFFMAIQLYRQKGLKILVVILILGSFDIGVALTKKNVINKMVMEDYLVMKAVRDLNLKDDVLVAPWDLGHKIHYYTRHSNISNPFWDWALIENEKDFARLNTAKNYDEIERVLDKYKTSYMIMSYSDVDYAFWQNLLKRKFTINEKDQQLYYQFYNPTPSKNLASSFRSLYQSDYYRVLEYKKNNRIILPEIKKVFSLSAKIKKSNGIVSDYYLQFGPESSLKEIIVAYDSTKKNGYTEVLTKYSIIWDEKEYLIDISDEMFKSGPIEIIDFL